MGLGGKLVACALLVAFYACESPSQAVVQFLNTLSGTSQNRLQVRIRREDPRWMHQRRQHKQSDARLNRLEGAIRPSGLWILAKLAAASEHYGGTREDHSYVYRQRVRIALNFFQLPAACPKLTRHSAPQAPSKNFGWDGSWGDDQLVFKVLEL